MDSSERVSVLKLLDESEAARGPVNFDRLMSAGVSLVRSGRQDADLPVLEWLGAQPSSRRLDIAAAALNGLWHPSFRTAPVPDQNVEMLIRARDAAAPEGNADYSFVQALCQVLRSQAGPALKDRVSAQLEAVLEQRQEPALKRRMESVIHGARGDER